MDIFEDIDLSDIIPIIVLGAVEDAKTRRTPRNTGLSGSDYLRELLTCGNDKRIYGVLRMKKETFTSLCLWLQQHTRLKESRYIALEEQVAIFLWIINYSASTWQTAERFQRSTATISR
ncbi:MAG: hypothetical protein QOH50_5264 [Kribbellaceae bacterium]|nr:hypothetical protein [Kribbellaceae bacterium]